MIGQLFWLRGPFKYYVMQWRVGASDFPEKVLRRCRFNIISVTRVGGCQISRKKYYITREWPLTCSATYGQTYLECMQWDSPCETYGSDLALSHLGHCPSPCQQIPVRWCHQVTRQPIDKQTNSNVNKHVKNLSTTTTLRSSKRDAPIFF